MDTAALRGAPGPGAPAGNRPFCRRWPHGRPVTLAAVFQGPTFLRVLLRRVHNSGMNPTAPDMVCATSVRVCVSVCVGESPKITFVPFSCFSRAGPTEAWCVLELPTQCVYWE